MECEESPDEAVSAGFSPVTPRTGKYSDFLAGVTGVFTCAGLGRFAGDYASFSHEVQCEFRAEDKKAVMTGAPKVWGPCKTGKSHNAHRKLAIL